MTPKGIAERTGKRLVYKWRCAQCGTRGQVTLDEHEGVWSAAEAFAAAHANKAPRCRGNLRQIRLTGIPRPTR